MRPSSPKTFAASASPLKRAVVRRAHASRLTTPARCAPLPGGPMFVGIGQQGVARDQAQVRRHGPCVEGVVMDGGTASAHRRRPSRGIGRGGRGPRLRSRGNNRGRGRRVLPDRRDGRAGNSRWPNRPGGALPPIRRRTCAAARQEQAQQRTGEGGERPGGRLGAAVGVAQTEADDAEARLFDGPAFGQGHGGLDEAGVERDVGVEQQHPFAATEAAAFVDGAGEAVVAPPAAQRQAGSPPQSAGGAAAGGVVVHDDDLRGAALQTRGGAELANEAGSVAPLMVVDDKDRQAWDYGGGLQEGRRRRRQIDGQGDDLQLHRDPSLGGGRGIHAKWGKYRRCAAI